MPIQRSKSAPQSIAGVSTVHVARSYSHENVHHKPVQVAPFRPGSSRALALPSSRVHKGDPFNLGNFFPTSRVFEEEEDWNWLRSDHSTHAESMAVVRTPAPMMFGLVGDKLATEAIKNEDKLGVLSLSRSASQLSIY